MKGEVSLQVLDVVIFSTQTIPWFVIGSSMVAADISSEQFISNVGGA
ncbi:MAG: hypothetical protein ABI042_02075 [Verrucomicrobiota bacterium]